MSEWNIKDSQVSRWLLLEYLSCERKNWISAALAFTKWLIKILYFGSSNHLAVQKQNGNYSCKMRLVSAYFFFPPVGNAFPDLNLLQHARLRLEWHCWNAFVGCAYRFLLRYKWTECRVSSRLRGTLSLKGDCPCNMLLFIAADDCIIEVYKEYRHTYTSVL